MTADDRRLTSGKAVAAALLLLGVLLAALGVFAYVIFERACAGRARSVAAGGGFPGDCAPDCRSLSSAGPRGGPVGA